MKYFNNPANIRYSPLNRWKGQLDPKNGFCQFCQLKYGIRALYITLRTYVEKYGLKEIPAIITRFAPPSENNTRDYILFVVDKVAFDVIDVRGFSMLQLIKAICRYETGFTISESAIHDILREFKYF